MIAAAILIVGVLFFFGLTYLGSRRRREECRELRARVSELEAALEPFAHFADVPAARWGITADHIGEARRVFDRQTRIYDDAGNVGHCVP